MKRWLLLALLIPSLAFGQALRTTDYSTTLGTTAVPCVPGDSSRKALWIENPAGGSNNIGYCVDATGNGCTPSIGTKGTSVLTPGVADSWALANAPAGTVYCIASAGSTPVTIRSYK